MDDIAKVGLVLTVALVAFGCLSGNSVQRILVYLVTVAGFFVFLPLGRFEQVWRVTYYAYLGIFAIGMILVFVGLDYPGMYVRFAAPTELSSFNRLTWTAGHDIRFLLNTWPLIVVYSVFVRRSRLSLVAAAGTLFMVVALDLSYFRYRYVVVQAVWLAVLILFESVRSKRSLRPALAITFVVALAVVPPLVMQMSDVRVMEERFGSDASDRVRWAEVSSLIEDFSAIDWVFGRGLGGSYVAQSEVRIYEPRLDGERRSETHIGLFFPVIVGGGVLCALFYGVVVSGLRRGSKGKRRDTMTQLSWILCVGFVSSLLYSPFPSYQDVFSVITGALATGALVGRCRPGRVADDPRFVGRGQQARCELQMGTTDASQYAAPPAASGRGIEGRDAAAVARMNSGGGWH